MDAATNNKSLAELNNPIHPGVVLYILHGKVAEWGLADGYSPCGQWVRIKEMGERGLMGTVNEYPADRVYPDPT